MLTSFFVESKGNKIQKINENYKIEKEEIHIF